VDIFLLGLGGKKKKVKLGWTLLSISATPKQKKGLEKTVFVPVLIGPVGGEREKGRRDQAPLEFGKREGKIGEKILVYPGLGGTR